MERIVAVVPEAGLHARPASKFVQTANRFDSEITVGRTDGDAVSANSMLAVTGLNIEHGEEIRITADGDDSEAALDELETLLTTPVEDEDGDGDENEEEASE
ncbi:HPr family phosphocarrier protein [Halonotius sp. F2-221B]|uniref:phosphocarrier protein HPr n=1 Tax=Halonotius sp. F2-221B TaxID=2731620 RepID=UPI00398AD112